MFMQNKQPTKTMARIVTLIIRNYLLQCITVICFLLTPGFTSDLEMQGHMGKLGMQRKSEGHIEILKELPSPVEFFEKYIKPGKPVVFKDAAKAMPAFKNWNDEYLREKFGDLQFDVEEGKKENRSLRTFEFTMKDFVDKYKKEDIYMVHSIHKRMRDDVTLLPVLSCGGYVNLLQDIVMWFSSGGTKSVLHNDNVDNINCLFSGKKELYMVDKADQRHVLFDANGYSYVNPDAVDLKKYPGLAQAPWWEAKMEAGDCLFIPVEWIHQVRSFDRNIAVNVWFTHPLKINVSDCESKDWSEGHVPLSKFQLKSNAGARQLLSLEVKEKGKMTMKEFHKFLQVALQAQDSEIKEIVDVVDKNKDRLITMDDIDALSEEDLAFIRQLMPMGADSEEEGSPYGDKEAISSDEDGDDSDGKVEPMEEDVEDGFPEPNGDQIDEEVLEERSHTEL